MVHRSVKVRKIEQLNLQITCNFLGMPRHMPRHRSVSPSGLDPQQARDCRHLFLAACNVLDTMVSARKFSTFDRRLQALESLVYDRQNYAD